MRRGCEMPHQCNSWKHVKYFCCAQWRTMNDGLPCMYGLSPWWYSVFVGGLQMFIPAGLLHSLRSIPHQFLATGLGHRQLFCHSPRLLFLLLYHWVVYIICLMDSVWAFRNRTECFASRCCFEKKKVRKKEWQRNWVRGDTILYQKHYSIRTQVQNDLQRFLFYQTRTFCCRSNLISLQYITAKCLEKWDCKWEKEMGRREEGERWFTRQSKRKSEREAH